MEAHGLSIKRGRQWILRDVDFRAAAGEITVIAGPNGSGKTTMLNALSQDLPYLGQVLINGVDAATLKPWQKAQIRGVLPQAGTLAFPFLVREILALGLSAGNAHIVSPGGKNDIPEAALQRVGLQGYGHRFYHELSGGEQARAQFARVLCQIWNVCHEGQPCWLLLDEPVASLDIEHQLVVMDIARKFARGGGGVIAVLHDLNLAAAYADKLILIKHGHIVHEGAPGMVMTTQNLHQVYNCRIEVSRVPALRIPFILPQTVICPSAE